jgi:hypothetical protein
MSKAYQSFLKSVETFRDSVQGSNESFVALNSAINKFKTSILLAKGKKLLDDSKVCSCRGGIVPLAAKTPQKLREKIDLSKARKGDRYLTKSGRVVVFDGPHNNDQYPFGFYTESEDIFLSYKRNGTYFIGDISDDRNIVAKA